MKFASFLDYPASETIILDDPVIVFDGWVCSNTAFDTIRITDDAGSAVCECYPVPRKDVADKYQSTFKHIVGFRGSVRAKDIQQCNNVMVEFKNSGGSFLRHRKAVVVAKDNPESSVYWAAINLWEESVYLPQRYDVYASGPPVSDINLEILNLLVLESAQARSILDFGCGTGSYIRALRRLGLSALGVEVSQEAAARAKESDTEIVLYDGRNLPFPDGQFDFIYALDTLEHIPELESCLQEILRCARGKIFFAVPDISSIPVLARYGVTYYHIHDEDHYNFFTPKVLENTILSAVECAGRKLSGFRVISSTLIPLSQFIGKAIFGHTVFIGNLE